MKCILSWQVGRKCESKCYSGAENSFPSKRFRVTYELNEQQNRVEEEDLEGEASKQNDIFNQRFLSKEAVIASITKSAEFGVQKTSFKAGSPGRACAQLQITCRVKKDIGGFLLQVAAGGSRLAGERRCKQAAAIREIWVWAAEICEVLQDRSPETDPCVGEPNVDLQQRGNVDVGTVSGAGLL